MPTGQGILDAARKHIGEPYDFKLVPKDDASWHGPWDCAEFASWLVFQEGGTLYGCAAGASAPATAEAHTGFWKRDAAALGTRIPVEQAAATPGAFLLRYPPGAGAMGHVVVSDGRGGTVEAMDRRNGVRAGTVAKRHWDTGILIPGFSYAEGAQPVPVPGPAVLYAEGQPNMSEAVVRRIQQSLKTAGFDPGPVSGLFDSATTAAVAAFQKAQGVVIDGEVGDTTAGLLGLSLRDAAGAAAGVALKGAVAANPLAAIAVLALPAIARMVARDPKGAVASKASEVVAEVAGTSDPAAAQSALEASPALQAQLKIRLEEIAMAEAEARREAEATERRDREAAEARQRSDELATLRTRLDDVEKARQAALAAPAGSAMSWGAIQISWIVTLGFFVILALFLWVIVRDRPIAEPSANLMQIVNIAIGALVVAFSTVVTFWLGSSEGSRLKDARQAVANAQQAEQNQKMAEGNQVLTENLVEKAANQPNTPILASATAMPQVTGPKVSNFRRCLDLVLEREGGFSNDPNDNGGATKFGITLATLRAFRDQPTTADDMRALTIEEASEIYRSRYWNMLRCDDLPAGIDLLVFDFGVNAGPARAARMLQTIVGAKVDGSVGDRTLAMTRTMPVVEIVERFSTAKLDFYKGLSDWPHFGDGWTNRVKIIKTAALGMLGPQQMVA